MLRADLIDQFLRLGHIAVVGVSRRPEEFVNTVYRRLRDGRVTYPVNELAGGHLLEGDLAYASLAEVPDPLDGVVLMVPAAEVAGVLRQVTARGIRHVWFHRGLGQPPVAPEALAYCAEHGISAVDGACPLMFLEPVRGVHRLHRFVVRRRLAA
jgi:uncharacterized protein